MNPDNPNIRTAEEWSDHCEHLVRKFEQEKAKNKILQDRIDALVGGKPIPINEYWPTQDISLNLITGSMEVGKDLFLLGNFGGFGGCLWEVHCDREEARTAAAERIRGSKFQRHASVYRLSVTLEDEMVHVYEEKKNT